MLKNRFKKLLIVSITAVLLYGCYSLYVQINTKSPVRYAQVVVESPFENVQTDTDIINTYFQEKVIVVKKKSYCDGVLLWETDYDRAGEEIKAVRYKSDGSIDRWEEYERREDGKKSAWICYRGDGSISSSGECKYDEAGNEIENVEYNHSGDITVKSTYVYDEAGNEIEHVQYFGDDIYRRYEYEYEEDGRKKKCIEYNGDGDIFSYKECEYDEAGHVTKEEYQDFAERIEYYYTYQYRYNEAGDIEKKICYDEDGSISYWCEYQNDEAGHELSELTYGTDGIYRRSEQKYDKNGNEIRVTYIVDGEVTMQLEFSRDEWGNVTEERGRSLAKEWDTNTYEYEYETVYVPSRQYTQAVVVNKKEYHDGALTTETVCDRAGNKTKRTWYNSDGSIERWAEYQYDENEKMIKEVRHDGDGSIYVQNKYTYDNVGNLMVYESASDDHNSKETYEYDEAGDMIRFVEYFDDDLYRRTEYEYDTAGKLVGYTVYNGDGNMCGYQIHAYEYDEGGNVIKDVTYGYDTANADSSMGSWHYSYECQYDKAGNMEKKISYITDDEYFMSEWEYDEKGRLLTEIEYYDDGVSIRTKDEYEYDSDGKRIKRIRTEYGETEEEITDFYYDEWGNLIEERTGEKSNTYEYEYEFVYTYPDE
ncbi:MAG: hypothetical protein HDR30_02320 [Lachnospiraceae bacterium]|nr:hypothetical protein [Lachnospiraceae bacterium]